MLTKLLLTNAAFVAFTIASAQPSTTGFDTLAVRKPKVAKEKFETAHPSLKELTIKAKRPQRSRTSFGNMAGDLGRKVVAGWIGNMSASQDVTWMLHGEVKTNEERMDWEADVYCVGELEKRSERVRNRDGSRSIETDKTATIFWNNGATLFILERNDTIGRFALTLTPEKDSAMAIQAGEVLIPKKDEALKVKSKWLNAVLEESAIHFYVDYAITGTLRGKELTLYFNSEEGKAWIFSEGKLLALYQSDNDLESAPMIMNRRETRIAPYLLFQKGAPAEDTGDYLRLGMVSRFLSEAVWRNTWQID